MHFIGEQILINNIRAIEIEMTTQYLVIKLNEGDPFSIAKEVEMLTDFVKRPKQELLNRGRILELVSQ
jgi:hypothetical protein